MRFNIVKVGDDIHIHKSKKGSFDKDYIEKISFEYKFIYKDSRNFRRIEHNEICSYSFILFSNEDYTDMLNFLKFYQSWITFIHNFKKAKTLYKIKEKINEI